MPALAAAAERVAAANGLAERIEVLRQHSTDLTLGGDDALFDAKLPVGERRRVHAALCALVAQKPRFKALVVDLAKISNGETSLDAILAYEIAPQ